MPAHEPETSRPLSQRLRLSIGAAVTVGLVVLSAAVGWGILRGQAAVPETVPLSSSDGDGEIVDADAGIYVHVLGEVTAPGIYLLDADARLVDALAAAGGSLASADLAAVNLARALTDGEQVVVPAQGEAGPAQTPGVADGKVDLNTADQAALETLPRIGPALAQRIIDWREQNGRFRSVDDLLSVPGIGEKLLAGIREGARV